MKTQRAKIRLYVEAALGEGQAVPVSREQANYLFNVMRLSVGDHVALFNGRDGEWTAQVMEAGKRKGLLVCLEQAAPQQMPPDVWLLFAPIKKARTDFIVEKATELGASFVQPVLTQFTNSDRVRREKLQAHAMEAAEQCGGTYVPEIAEVSRLDKVLEDWPAERRILFCDERMEAPSAAEALAKAGIGPWAILIGPEGGFSDSEAEQLRKMDCVTSVTLGPRVLRADTAAVAALTLWQATLGDWS